MQEFLHVQFLVQIRPEEVGGEAGVEAAQGATRGRVVPMPHTNTRLGPEHVTNLKHCSQESDTTGLTLRAK